MWSSKTLIELVLLQVKALDGPNEGFIFPAAGQVHRNAYLGLMYGGIVFAYSADSMRIFVPSAVDGTAILISDHWGSPNYTQMSNNIEVIVKIWSSASATYREYIRIPVISVIIYFHTEYYKRNTDLFILPKTIFFKNRCLFK